MPNFKDQEEWQQMVEDCEARESRLSDWETNFIDSINDQLFKSIGLSRKQSDILNTIWEKATERG